MITTMTVVTEQLTLGMYLQFTVDQKWRKVTLQHLSTITDCHLQRRQKNYFTCLFHMTSLNQNLEAQVKGFTLNRSITFTVVMMMTY